MNIAALLTGVVSLMWLLAVLAVVLVIVRATRNQPVRSNIVVVLVTVLIALLLTSVNAGLVFIEPQERGVVISALSPKGYREQALAPGLHWVFPFAESVVTYPISKQTYTMSIAPSEGQVQGDDSIAARTADGQQILIDASVIFSIDPNRVVEVHINWQNRYSDDLVRAQARGVIRDVVSQYKVEEAVSTKRLEMSDKFREQMGQKLTDNGLVLVDFVLRNIQFSDEYAASVEQKQIAEQQAQQAKFVVESKKQEAEQARQIAQGRADAAVIEAKGAAEAVIIAAEAEAKALILQAEALKDKPDLLTYTYIQKISPNVQVMFLPNNAPFVFPLPTVTSNQTTTVVPTVVPTVEPTTAPTTTP
jgi:regulator of protease activity HflC (stomatin/prohibitin superfamily)